MRAVVQRVASSSVTIDEIATASIGRGLLILVGIQRGDTEADASWLATKIAGLRVFPDADDKMNLSLADVGPTISGQPMAIVVSQFTLFASTRKGTRPSFNGAADPAVAIPLYERFIRELEAVLHRPVAQGRFGAKMQVALVNDGPVTLIIDSRLRE